MIDDYVTVAGKRLRKGYTTGSCAAAASKAATQMLVGGVQLAKVCINTPAGKNLELPLIDGVLGEGYAECAVIKDGGDDPDITTGLKIFAKAEYALDHQITVKAEEGIGTVTLPGLKVEVGRPAINPVPMRMIQEAVREVLPPDQGVIITLRVPGGEKLAQRTYNPKLGIIGGISIIGTTGIVEPMSEDAWKEALALELKVLKNKGYQTCVFVFGNYGQEFAVNFLGIGEVRVLKISNFVGYMLEKAVEYEFESLLIIGHLGKLVKVAGGIFHTHSRVADARMEILALYAALEGGSLDTVQKIYECKTTEAAARIINTAGLKGVYRRIAENTSRRCTEFTYQQLRIGTVLFNEDHTLLYTDQTAEAIILELKNGAKP
jgi:cobalt-precorrin-5B (C1)-methyltransferase